jgi:hypothetical protein
VRLLAGINKAGACAGRLVTLGVTHSATVDYLPPETAVLSLALRRNAVWAVFEPTVVEFFCYTATNAPAATAAAVATAAPLLPLQAMNAQGSLYFL